MGRDGENGEFFANMAYFALVKFHILPHELLALPKNEQAFIFACIKVYIQKEKQEIDKLKNKHT